MTDPTLLEQVVSAWRERVRGEIRGLPAFYDLDEAGRVEAFEQTLRARDLEAAADPEGLSPTARSVLARIRGAR